MTIDLEAMGQAARKASRQLATLTSQQKNNALLAIATELETNAAAILTANNEDIERGRANGLTEALLDRLLLNEKRLAGLVADTRRIVDLPDPVGEEFDARLLPNGLRLSKRRIPVGVLGVIYEARPNVTIDIATLCLKTGNAAILRGGSETLCSNIALVELIQNALVKVGLPPAAVQAITDPDRALVRQLLRLDRYVDMLIPRGGQTCTGCAGTKVAFRLSRGAWAFAMCLWMKVPIRRGLWTSSKIARCNGPVCVMPWIHSWYMRRWRQRFYRSRPRVWPNTRLNFGLRLRQRLF